MGKCSLKTASKVIWKRSYASSPSSLINTGFQLIYCNEFLKFDMFSSEKTLELIDIESSGRVRNFSLANTG